MSDNTVQISLEVVKRGFENIQELNRQLGESRVQVEQYQQRIQTLEAAHQRHNDVLTRARKGIQDFRREMFLFTFTAATMSAIILGLAKSSDALSAQLESAGGALTSMGNSLGNLLAKSHALDYFTNNLKGLAAILEAIDKRTGGTKAIISLDTANTIGGLQSRTAALGGDSRFSQELQLEVEFLQKIQPLLEKTKGTIGQAGLAAAWRDYRAAAEDALRRSELGLRNNLEIAKQFARQIADAFEHIASDPVFNFLQGEKQTGADILKGFQTNINRAIADAFGAGVKNALFGGGAGGLAGFFSGFKDAITGKNKTVDAVNNVNREIQKSNGILAAARECICRTAENTAMIAAMGRGGATSFEGTITPPKKSALDKIGAIAGAIAMVGGAAGGGGGGSVGGGAPQPGIEFAPRPVMHSGGWVPAFPSGGEVPITAQPGEFVVRKAVASMNKDFLKDFNLRGDARRSQGGGQNVFLIKANDAASFDDMLATPAGRQRIEIQLMRAIMQNGSVRRTIKDFAK